MTATVNLPSVQAADEVLCNTTAEGINDVVRVPIAKFSAQVEALRGPKYELKSELDADLDWVEDAEARVWGDPVLANRGVYKKSGAVGAGSWTRLGPLPETDISHSMRVPEDEFILPFPDAATRAGTVPIFDAEGHPIAGPTAADIANAQTYAAQAAASAQGVDDARVAAEAAQASAEGARDVALAHKDKAQQWAEEAEDAEVEPGLYSARHWAAKAEEERNGILTDATTVLGSGRVPVGFMIPWHGLKAPNQYWVLVDTVGQVFSRSLFPALLDVFAPEFAVSFSGGNPVVTGINCPQALKAGWAVEGTNVPGGTTILSVDSPTQITLSANPTGDGTVIRIFPHGNGDGATTAHYPSVAGRVIRGLDSTGAVNPDADNVVGETQEDALQNITGGVGYVAAGNRTDGAFYDGAASSVLTNSSANSSASEVRFDASHVARTADETRVKSIIAPYIVKVADGVDDPAIVSAANVVADLAAAQANIAALQVKAGAVAILEYQQPNGTAGGSTVATTWTVWPVNTEVSDPNGIVSLSSNQFTPMVDCDCDVEVILLRGHYHRIRIYNVTDGVVVGEPGPGTFAHPTYGDQAISTVRRLLTAGKTYQIEYWASVALATDGLGAATSSGAAEVFGSVTLRAI